MSAVPFSPSSFGLRRPAVTHSLPALPASLTSFVGRDVVTTALAAILRPTTIPADAHPSAPAANVRLLTLTGPGGVGKTRLAIQAAATLHTAFPNLALLVTSRTPLRVSGEQRFAAAWATGRALLPDEVFAAATSAPDVTPVLTDPNAESGLDLLAILTPRELDVLRLVAAGHANRTIAAELYLSTATIKRHVTNILANLNAPTRADAIRRAHQLGLEHSAQ